MNHNKLFYVIDEYGKITNYLSYEEALKQAQILSRSSPEVEFFVSEILSKITTKTTTTVEWLKYKEGMEK